MSVVQPQGTLHLLRGIPFTSSYEHSIYFRTPSEQESWFLKSVYRSFDKLSYIADNIVKVECPIDEIRECSYLMYRNTGFENKWFFAFIQGLTRISNNVTAIEFQIDVIQTWYLFNTKQPPCFIERIHDTDANIYNPNFIPEGLETGEYEADPFYNLNFDVAYLFCVTQYYDGTNWINTSGNIYGGVFTGAKLFAPPTYQEAAQFLYLYNSSGRGDAIINITTIPKFMIDYTGDIDYEVKNSGSAVFRDYNISLPLKYLNGYVPKNFKLFTYPFSYIMLTNNAGQELPLKYEYFKIKLDKDGYPFITVRCVGTVSCTPQVMAVPLNYKITKDYGSSIINYNENISTEIYPPISYTTDNYRSWLAQTSATRATSASLANFRFGTETANMINVNNYAEVNQRLTRSQNTMNYLKEGASMAANLATLNAGGMIGNAANLIEMIGTNQAKYNLLTYQNAIERNNAAFSVFSAQNAIQALSAQVADHSVIPPSGKGNMTADLLFSMGLKGFTFYFVHPTLPYLKRIDDYFQMFGYAAKKVDIPNIHGKKYWTYVKTTNCYVTPQTGSGCSSADINNINTVLNNGITFWNGNEGMLKFLKYETSNPNEGD